MTKKEMFREALWVQADGDCVSPTFRGTFTAHAGEKAKITICGLGFFELYINGKAVSEDVYVPMNSHYHNYADCRCFVKHGEEMSGRIYGVQYDLTPYLQEGENVLTALVGPGWYFRYGQCRLIYCIEKNDTVVSDLSLRWRESPVSAYELTKGEKQDYTKLDFNDGYMLPGYDDSAWGKVQEAPMPETEYTLQDCPADRVIRSLTPVVIGETETAVFYDLGENVTGRPVLRCREKKEIMVAAGEIYDEETKTLPERWAHGQVTTFLCDGTDREYYPIFTWDAGRYYEVTKGAEFVCFDVIHTDAPVISAFTSDNETLNWLYDAYIRTQLCNMHAGIPSDCPHLERRGYTGDGQLCCEAVMLMISSKDFYRKWMRDISDCQDRKSGHIQYTAPYVESGGGPGGWGCAIVEVPYVYYRTYNDAQPLHDYFPQMLRYFDYLNDHSEKDLVVSDQPNCWCLGDWCMPGDKSLNPALPNPYVNTYFFVKSLDRVIEIAQVLGEQAKIPTLKAMREKKVEAIVRKYFNPETGDFADNVNGANAFALDLGLGNEKTLMNLVEQVRSLDVVHTGIFGTDLVPKVLFENGYGAEAVRFLTHHKQPSFGYMMDKGATTLWEEWDAPRSMSHPMFGAPMRYFFYYLLGIRQTADSCGYEKIVIDPVEAGVNFVKGHVDTVSGTIAVEIDRTAGTIVLELPEGMEVTYKGKTVHSGTYSL